MAATVFFSYCHKDEALRDQLEVQLAALKRQGVIETWHDRRIGAGEEFASAIDDHVNSADIILLLVSSDFIASNYCYDVEMKRALERHDAKEAIVIPVILRACDWHGTPFGKLQATPPDGKPVTQIPDRDQAFLEVVKAVRQATTRHGEKVTSPIAPAPRTDPVSVPAAPAAAGPRSSNLSLARTFTDHERDTFKHASFDYIARFFKNSLDELAARHEGIETTFRDGDERFVAGVYRSGKAISQCTVFIGDQLIASGIGYLASETTSRGGYNELLTIEADDVSMYLRSIGIAARSGSRDTHKLTQEGAAEHLWAMLIEKLQPAQRS